MNKDEKNIELTKAIKGLLEALDVPFAESCDCGGSSLCAVCNAHRILKKIAVESIFDRHAIMEQWDSWRRYIADGGTGSWPRDAFEALLGQFEERLARYEGQGRKDDGNQ